MNHPAKIPLARINAMSAGEFSRAFGAVYEHSAWIAERAFVHRPFTSVADLHAAMKTAVVQASAAEQLALLRAHPELAGREARAGELTASSSAEQRSAGLDALSADEVARIAALNRAHADRFGFPFIIAVRLASKAEVFSELERRLGLDRDAEMGACLEQVFRISDLRLRDLIE